MAPVLGGFIFGFTLNENAEVEVIVVRNRVAVSKISKQSAAIQERLHIKVSQVGHQGM